jgi:hypothetical protein
MIILGTANLSVCRSLFEPQNRTDNGVRNFADISEFGISAFGD